MTSWVDENVHSWSFIMTLVLRQEMPQLAAESHTASDRFKSKDVKAVIPSNLWGVVDKIESRRGRCDPDLCGVDPLGLLQIAWEETPRDDDGARALADLLADIGQTCLQGDTHRLFFYLRAVRMSKMP